MRTASQMGFRVDRHDDLPSLVDLHAPGNYAFGLTREQAGQLAAMLAPDLLTAARMALQEIADLHAEGARPSLTVIARLEAVIAMAGSGEMT